MISSYLVQSKACLMSPKLDVQAVGRRRAGQEPKREPRYRSSPLQCNLTKPVMVLLAELVLQKCG